VPERAQQPPRIGAHLNAGADPQELLRLLVDRDLGALPSQQRADREPADPGAHDGVARFGAHAQHSDPMTSVAWIERNLSQQSIAGRPIEYQASTNTRGLINSTADSTPTKRC